MFTARYGLGLEIKRIAFRPYRVDVHYSNNVTCLFVCLFVGWTAIAFGAIS